MLDANRSGTATASPRAAAQELVAPVLPLRPAGLAARCTRVLLSPYARLSLLVALLGLEDDIEVVAQVARGDEVLAAVGAHGVDVA
ncbi:hypothetical protein ACWDE9_33305, partial [Streptomyces olivaceoviridis]